ncbi:MAG: P-type conjugative transfer ATPase TrbB [Alphaproteobacteria bacterium]|nr:P-type conjugative transfer ATPase TrbB [Alphaproteobacteria bacterium]
MSAPARHAETDQRRLSMLRSACEGAVRAALDADDVIEILANPDGSIWIERAGRGIEIEPSTITAAARERIIRLVASSIGEACDRSAPIISAELTGSGERFQGLLPPVSEAPCFAIRKSATVPFKLDDYVDQGALAPATATALRAALDSRANILIAGGTSSGKTTFTNALLAEPSLSDERIVLLEDTRELKCAAANAVSLRTHRDRITLTDLVRSTMRLRPDRIVVGEVRGPEALDLLKAWNTGHPGGITTLHANSARAALQRLEQLAMEAATVPPRALIAESIDVVLFMSRQGGKRCVEEAISVSGFDGDAYITAPLVSRSLSLVSEAVVTQGDKS